MPRRSRLLARLKMVHVDLTAILVLVCLAILSILIPVLSETPVRVLVGLLFILVAPGYALLAAFFPESTHGEGEAQDDARVDLLERIALAIGLSVALVVVVGGLLTLSPWKLTSVSAVGCLSGITLAGVVVGGYRRERTLNELETPFPPTDSSISEDGGRDNDPSHLNGILNVSLAIALLGAILVLVLAVSGPLAGEPYTELYLETDGPEGNVGPLTELNNGTVAPGTPLAVVVDNQEHSGMTYGIIVERQVYAKANGSKQLTSREQLLRTSVTLDIGESWRRSLTIEATPDGVARLAVHLYVGSLPSDSAPESASQTVHVWVSESEDTIADERL